MKKSTKYKVLSSMPKEIPKSGQMHPETRALIDQVKRTRGKVLAYNAGNPDNAKRRADALRRATKRGHISVKAIRRLGQTVYVQVK